MLAIFMDGIKQEGVVNELNGNATSWKDDSVQSKSPNSTLSPQNLLIADPNLPIDGAVDTSIEHLYDNVCDMHSSDQSLSRPSFASDGDESRINSELHHLVGGETMMRESEIIKGAEVQNPDGDCHNSDSASKKDILSTGKTLRAMVKSESLRKKSLPKSKKVSHLKLESETSLKSSPQVTSLLDNKPPMDKGNRKKLLKQRVGVTPVKKWRNPRPIDGVKMLRNGTEDLPESGLDNPDLSLFLLKQARDLISSGDNYEKALELALRAAKSFEKCATGKKPSLEFVLCLHVTAAIHCSLGQYGEAVPVLQRSIGIPVIKDGQEHALAKFAGHMQLGDTYVMLGQLENSIHCYAMGLEVQRQVLGETDPRVGETCRYVAEAHIQALRFAEAEKLCQMALDIHKENDFPASIEEAADRRLMGLICEMKGNHEAALEHLVLASMAMVSNGHEIEMASVDCSIGDTYLSLGRYDEAAFSYQKALTVFKSSKGENHPSVASVFVRLADLYNKMGKIRESKSYCKNALRIYGKPNPGIPPEEISSGLTDVSGIFQSMNDLEQALELLEKALKMYDGAPGQQSTIAGIEAQMGVMYYMLGDYSNSYTSFKKAISKIRASGEKKSAFFGIALNQMGLACVQRYAINEAAELFEEARSVLEQECGQHHPDTLGVYSNLAGTYDAVGRLDDAIEILEFVVGIREEKLGTANPDVDDEKRRLSELLKEAGRVGSRKARSLETLLDANSNSISRDGSKV